MLKLYYHPYSTFSQRVRIALLEKQIPAEQVEVDLFSRAQFSPEYLSKNPYGRVPAIEEDGLVLYESTAILEYLEATRPAPPLLPTDVRSRAVVAMHLKLCDLEFAEPSRVILVPKRFLPQERWRIDEGWWSDQSVSRIYWRLVLDNGQLVTVFLDMDDRTWWEQRA